MRKSEGKAPQPSPTGRCVAQRIEIIDCRGQSHHNSCRMKERFEKCFIPPRSPITPLLSQGFALPAPPEGKVLWNPSVSFADSSPFRGAGKRRISLSQLCIKSLYAASGYNLYTFQGSQGVFPTALARDAPHPSRFASHLPRRGRFLPVSAILVWNAAPAADSERNPAIA